MIIERENNRRQIEQNYRRQLLNDIHDREELKNRSRIMEKTPPKETFSLIKNIEEEQNKRMNKQKEYYADLQMQRQEAIRLKKQRQEEQRRRDREIDQKIARQNQMLRKRHQEEKRREGSKKQIAQEMTRQVEENLRTENQKKRKFEPFKEQPMNYKNSNKDYPEDVLDNIANSRDQILEQNFHNSRQQNYPPNLIFQSRIENQAFNFAPREHRNVGYYQQLAHQRRKFEEETNSLHELNRILGAEKNYYKRSSGGGMQSLRQLQKLLDDQSHSVINQNTFMKDSFKRSKTYNTHKYYNL